MPRRPEGLPEFDELLDLYWGGPERRITGLTLRIIGVNFAALVMLMLGIVYLSQYQTALIESKLKTFKAEIQLTAVALGEGAIKNDDAIDLSVSERMVARLSGTMNQRIYLFDGNGALVADSDKLPQHDALKGASEENGDNSLYTIRILKNMAHFVLMMLPNPKVLPLYIDKNSGQAADYIDAADAISGVTSISAWRAKDDSVVLSAAAPLFKNGKVAGAVMLVRQARDIAQEIGEVWMNILSVFLATLIITTALSIYLSGAIASPLRKLARAADAMRRGKSKDAEIPDLSYRKDEIGELSLVLREMTQALWDRMDTIEHFAADVAHELKNPLTSMRSAVETLEIVKKDKDRERLLEIIKHDVERMDRLITDISTASRLDAELSREDLEAVNLSAMARKVVEIHQNPLMRGRAKGKNAANVNVEFVSQTDSDAYVWGRESRLLQVLENLVSNALSFSPDGGAVTIEISGKRKNIIVLVKDEGPGIPENKLETIFERFYTERPEHEAFGGHSGLGLSICRQIVTAMGGRIFAENIKEGDEGEIRGARFTLILNGA